MDDRGILAGDGAGLLCGRGQSQDPHCAFVRQVGSYWEMAAAMVLHGALSAELFVDCNAEGLYLLAKFAPILADVWKRNPGFLVKTSDLVRRNTAAAARYETVQKNVEVMRNSRSELAAK